MRSPALAAVLPKPLHAPPRVAGDLSLAIVPCEGCGKYVQGQPRLTPAYLKEGGFIWHAADPDCKEDCRT